MSDDTEKTQIDAIKARRALLEEKLANKLANAASIEESDSRDAEIGGRDDTLQRAADRQALGAKIVSPETNSPDLMSDVLGVYLSIVEHQPQLLLYDDDGHPIAVPFINHTLIVRDKNLHEQIELNMRNNPAYRSQITRCSTEQARMIMETITRTQREIATSGPASTPLVRAMDAIRANALAIAKQEIMDNAA